MSLCKDLLSSDHVSQSLTPQLMACLKYVLKSPHDRMQEVANIISDIQMPNVIEEQAVDPDKLHQLKYKVTAEIVSLSQTKASRFFFFVKVLLTFVLESGLDYNSYQVSDCTSKIIILQLASVNMNLNELGELLSEAVSKQDFVSAAEVKEKISVLEVSKQALQEEMLPKPVVMPSQVMLIILII